MAIAETSQGSIISRRRLLFLSAVGAVGLGAKVGSDVIDRFRGSHKDDLFSQPADFLRPGDQGTQSLTETQKGILSRNYPELSSVAPRFNNGYASKFANHDLLVYPKDISEAVNGNSIDSMAGIDSFFAGNSELLTRQEYRGQRFSARVRPEADSMVMVVPSHFPFPGEKAPNPPTNFIEWRFGIDRETNSFIAAVRTPRRVDVNPVQHALFLGDTINAASIAQTIELVPDRKDEFSSVDKKAIYEVLGDAVLAKGIGATYDNYVKNMKARNYTWIAPEELFDRIPSTPTIFAI